VGKNCGSGGGPKAQKKKVKAHCVLDTKDRNTHSEYVILIAFPLQQWLHELASALRYTCTDFLVIIETQAVWCNYRILTVFMK